MWAVLFGVFEGGKENYKRGEYLMCKGNEQWGLVFAGGGGKGAYEIGAWKAIRELCKDLNIVSVAGTSVGALNAVLYAIGDYDLAYDIWRYQVTSKVILANKSIDEMKRLIFNLIKDNAILFPMVKGKTNSSISKLRHAICKESVLPATLSLIKELLHEGIFSRDGLKDIIVHNQIMEKMNVGVMPCYAACYNLSAQKMEYHDLRNAKEDEFIDILLASSALPFIFPMQKIDGNYYMDGCVKDNVPFKKLYDEGIHKLIVIHLDCGESVIDNVTYKDATIVHLRPQKSLKGFKGTITFDPDVINALMEQGYQETVANLIELETGMPSYIVKEA